jgi:hypothetical protein
METTPWMKLYAACHDHALITVTGLDYDFLQSYRHYLVQIFMILLPGHWMDRSSQKVTLALVARSALLMNLLVLLWPWHTCVPGVHYLCYKLSSV